MLVKSIRLVLVACLLLFASSAQAAPQAPSLNHAGNFIPTAAEIGEQFQALVTGGDPVAEIEPQETFGTRALGLMLDSFKLLYKESQAFVENFGAFPELTTWVNKQISEELLSQRWIEAGQLTLIVGGGAFIAGWFVDFIFMTLRRRIYRRTYHSQWAKFRGVLAWLLLSLVPVVVFIAVALSILEQYDPSKLARFLVMTVVYAMAIFRLVRVVLRFFLSAKVEGLRFIPMSTPMAMYLTRWGSWLAGVVIIRYFVSEVGKSVKVPLAVISSFSSLAALLIVAMTITIILQKKSQVSTAIRGNFSIARASNSLMESVRLWLARTWHLWAIGYLVIGYFVTMLGEQGGFAVMMQGTFGTVLALFVSRLFFFFISRFSQKKRQTEITSGIYRPVLALLFKVSTSVLAASAILASWGVDVLAIATSAWGNRILGSAFSITSTLLMVVLLYELLSRWIERKLNGPGEHEDGTPVVLNSRARTLLPMVQKAAIMILSLIVGIVTLSELGINIAPLLAGAGVLGVAVGFGSQNLVKDF
ncbi:MAG: hypothetical protein AB7E52_08845, partial [Bdellovibrionales bacterium]